MDLGYDRNLYMLAFDHRGSFKKSLLEIEGEPTPADTAKISDAKTVIFEGFLQALERGAPKEEAGLLVDEEFGADIARAATARGAVLAMPAEKSGMAEFDFEFGDHFGPHIDGFDPSFVKVLVRYNPDGDLELNTRQAARLRRLSDWLHEGGRRFLFELLVPPTEAQLDSVSRESERYDREIRPALMVRVIEELQGWAVEPDIWKIEGIDAREDCKRIAEQARAGERDASAASSSVGAPTTPR